MQHLRTVRINKTRKEHSCIGCLKKFRKGSWLWYHVGVFDGFYAYHLCNKCQEELTTGDYSDGFVGGEIKDTRRGIVKRYLQRRSERTNAAPRLDNCNHSSRQTVQGKSVSECLQTSDDGVYPSF